MSGLGHDLEPGRWIEAFGGALQARHEDALALFGSECYWRDLLAFTSNIETFEGRQAIGAMLRGHRARARPTRFHMRADWPTADGREAWFTFETAIGRGVGHVRLREGRAWTLLTALRELEGHEEPAGRRRPHGVEPSWADRRAREAAQLGTLRQPYVLIVGGGQGGIAPDARAASRRSPACPRTFRCSR